MASQKQPRRKPWSGSYATLTAEMEAAAQHIDYLPDRELTGEVLDRIDTVRLAALRLAERCEAALSPYGRETPE